MVSRPGSRYRKTIRPADLMRQCQVGAQRKNVVKQLRGPGFMEVPDHGKSENKMDDLGVAPILGHLRIYIYKYKHTYICHVHT